MRILLTLCGLLFLSGCGLFGGGSQQTTQPAQPVQPAKPKFPIHPELERSQAWIDEVAANQTSSSHFQPDLERAQTALDQARVIWKKEKGKVDEDDEEWMEILHLNHVARQRAAIVVMKTRGLDVKRELDELQSRHKGRVAPRQRPVTPRATPQTIPGLPMVLQSLHPRLEARGLVLTLGEHFFQSGQAWLVNSEALLDALLEYLAANPGKNVACEGYSDSRDGHAAGQRLSQQRARTVQEALLERGVEFSRITAVGYGAERPQSSVPSGGSRRVEIVISDAPPIEYGADIP